MDVNAIVPGRGACPTCALAVNHRVLAGDSPAISKDFWHKQHRS
ncbi:unnamed protein product, partial [Staurois parvus]